MCQKGPLPVVWGVGCRGQGSGFFLAKTSRQPRLGRGRQGHPVSPVPELTSHLSCKASGTWKLAPGEPVARKGNLELGPQKPFLKFSMKFSQTALELPVPFLDNGN